VVDGGRSSEPAWKTMFEVLKKENRALSAKRNGKETLNTPILL